MTLTACRFFSHSVERALLKTRTPGLFVFENFLPQKSYEKLLSESIALREKIDRVREVAQSLQIQKHIPVERHYRAVVVSDQYRSLKGDDFRIHGVHNHALTYFTDNPNIPLFVSTHLISPIVKLPVIAQLCAQGFLNWQFSLNTYTPSVENPGQLAAFEYRKDIEADGLVTMIYSLGAQALFRIREPAQHKNCETLALLSNSPLILSGKARWDYEHGIFPAASLGPSLSVDTPIRRIALVLGCKPVPIPGTAS